MLDGIASPADTLLNPSTTSETSTSRDGLVVRGLYKAMRQGMTLAFKANPQARHRWVRELDAWAKIEQDHGDPLLAVAIDQAARFAFGDVTASDEFDQALGYEGREVEVVSATLLPAGVRSAAMAIPSAAKLLLTDSHQRLSRCAMGQSKERSSCKAQHQRVHAALAHLLSSASPQESRE